MRERSVDHTERQGADASDASRGAVLPPRAADQGIQRGSASFGAAGRRTLLTEEAPFLNGKYILKRKLGAGGMSQVWAALEPYSDNVVAIKLLHDQGGNLALRFRQECRFYPKLQHPNIVRMSQAGEDENGTMYIIMDLLKGSTVRRVLTSSRLKIVEALHLAIQLADACAYMHRKGVWHRDLKPENLMVGTKDEWKGHLWLFDFGISKFANLEDGGLNTDELPEVASVRYMAPEQVDGTRRHQVDGRADIYSFGVILYELITGRHTFVKANEPTTAAQIMNGHLVAHVRPIPHIVPECDEALWDLVKKCLARDPSERFQNFEEIGETLGNIRRTTLPPDHYIAQRVKKEVLRVARSRAFAASEIDDEDRDEQAREGGGDRAPDSAHRRPTSPGIYPAFAQEVALRAAQKSAIAKSRRADEPRQSNQPSDDSSVDDVGIETPRVVRPTEPMPLAFHPPAQVLPFGRSIAPQRGGVGDTERLPGATTRRPMPPCIEPTPTAVSNAEPANVDGATEPLQRQRGAPPSSLTPISTISMQASPSTSISPLPSQSLAPTPPPLSTRRSGAYAPAVAIGLMVSLLGSGAILLVRGRGVASPTPAATTMAATEPTTSPTVTAALLPSAEPTTAAPTAEPVATAAPTAEPVATASPSATAIVPPLPSATAVPSVPARVPAAKRKPTPTPAKPAPQPSAPPLFQPLFTLPPEKPKHGSLDLDNNAQLRHAESSGSLRHG
jgi:serine/threonine-protein kinase